MKAILEFNLPEEREEHERAVKALDWAMLVWHIDKKIRNLIKYDEGELSEDECDRLQKIRDFISSEMVDNGLVFPT